MPAGSAEHPAAPVPRLRCELPAEPRSVSRLRHAVVQFAREHGVGEATLGDIALAVTEAATNAVLHAFVGRPPGTLVLAAEPQPDALLVRVVDDGRGMQPRADSPGLGMGLPTMGQLAERLDLREGAGGHGTEVRMVFPAPGVCGAPTATVDEERLAVLAEVGRLAERAGWPAQGLEQLADVLVPRVAAACALELLEAGEERQRLVARGSGAPPEGLLEAVAADGLPRDEDGWCAAPVRAGDRVRGVIALLPATPHDAAVAAFAELLAERIAGGVATTRLIAELGRTRRRLERILGSLTEAITVNDERGTTVYANPAAVELLGAADLAEVLAAAPGELAARFVMTREDGSPVAVDDLPGRRLVAGRPAPPLLTRSVERRTGRARWLLTRTSLLDDDGLLAVNVIEDVTEAKEAEGRLRLLVEVGELLAAPVDFERTLERVTGLIVPTVADWAAIDLLAPEGRLQRVALAHVEPAKVRLGLELNARYPPDPGVLLGDGRPQLFTELTDELLAERARDEEHLRLLREIGLRSAIVVPLRARGRVTGALTLVTAESRRAFTEADLAFAEDLARRAAVAVDAARTAHAEGA